MKTMMTEISSRQWEFVTRENLTPKEAVLFLESGMQVRTFQDIVAEVCHTVDVEQQLLAGLFEINQIEKKIVARDSLKKKIRNWMSGKNLPTDRDDVFSICFALNLNLEQAEKMLIRLTEQGIHYRNRKEVVYAYSFKYGIGYRNARELLNTLVQNKQEKGEYVEPVTQILKTEFKQISGQEDLFSFMLAHQNQLGEKHNTPYIYFEKMLSLLTCEGVEGEVSYSLEYIAENYLRFNMPYNKRTGTYTQTQKVIKKYWPGASAIKSMKCRMEEVNRKTLLLLYLVTGGVWDGCYEEVDETYIGSHEFLERHCDRMNQMLIECGMCTIDPRNIFDYLILYCMRPENVIYMSERMELLIKEIFEETL